MSEEKNDVSYKALMDKGQVLFDTKEYKEAIKVYKLIQVMYGETLDEVSLASLYIRFANAYYCLEDRDKSTYYYEEYLKIYPQGQLSVFSRLAHAYYYLDADKCVDYHNKSLNFETTKYPRIILNDGTILLRAYTAYNQFTYIIDINGMQGPNVSGRDVFQVAIDKTASIPFVRMLAPKVSQRDPVTGEYTYKDNTNEIALNNIKNNACKNSGNYCGYLIERNGYKIPNDYPIRI